ncbi:hypothetical protein EAF00_006438 [Botryotinia globosa]|nr:hypothetical protein EAF00_006438 [Botryotinia globosa]
MDQILAGIVLTLLIAGCALLLVYYICQKLQEYRNNHLANEADNYEMGRLESGGGSFESGESDREEGTATRDNESATAGGAGGDLEGEGSGDIGLARTLPLEE